MSTVPFYHSSNNEFHEAMFLVLKYFAKLVLPMRYASFSLGCKVRRHWSRDHPTEASL